jgi:hypothetical protein
MCSWFQVLPSAMLVRLPTPVIWYNQQSPRSTHNRPAQLTIAPLN